MESRDLLASAPKFLLPAKASLAYWQCFCNSSVLIQSSVPCRIVAKVFYLLTTDIDIPDLPAIPWVKFTSPSFWIPSISCFLNRSHFPVGLNGYTECHPCETVGICGLAQFFFQRKLFQRDCSSSSGVTLENKMEWDSIDVISLLFSKPPLLKSIQRTAQVLWFLLAGNCLFIPSKGSPQDTGNNSQHRDQETVETPFCNFFPHNCYRSEGSSILHDILSSIWNVSDVMYTFMFLNLGFI